MTTRAIPPSVNAQAFSSEAIRFGTTYRDGGTVMMSGQQARTAANQTTNPNFKFYYNAIADDIENRTGLLDTNKDGKFQLRRSTLLDNPFSSTMQFSEFDAANNKDQDPTRFSFQDVNSEFEPLFPQYERFTGSYGLEEIRLQNDRNNDGYLTSAELDGNISQNPDNQKMTRNLKKLLKNSQSGPLFLDLNGDGRISLNGKWTYKTVGSTLGSNGSASTQRGWVYEESELKQFMGRAAFRGQDPNKVQYGDFEPTVVDPPPPLPNPLPLPDPSPNPTPNIWDSFTDLFQQLIELLLKK